MNILITGNKKKRSFYPILDSLNNYFSTNYPNNIIYTDTFVENKKKDYIYNDIYSGIVKNDLVISIGGDGSILSAVRRMKNKQIPLLGIHIGNLGFLNQCNKNNYINTLDDLLNKKKITFNKFFLLESKFLIENKISKKMYSLNDIVINQSKISRLITLSAFNKGTLINEFSCDGLIIATPLGSTGYSLSARGPIISPDVKGVIITPISPHRLSSSPIVVNTNSLIKIKFPKKYYDLYISSDGQESYRILPNSIVEVKKSKFYAKFVKLPKSNDYFMNLRKKLGW